MGEPKYPNKTLASFTDNTWALLTVLAERDERFVMQQIRWFVNLGIWAEIGLVVVYLLSIGHDGQGFRPVWEDVYP